MASLILHGIRFDGKPILRLFDISSCVLIAYSVYYYLVRLTRFHSTEGADSCPIDTRIRFVRKVQSCDPVRRFAPRVPRSLLKQRTLQTVLGGMPNQRCDCFDVGPQHNY
jgi:hypothetical protein